MGDHRHPDVATAAAAQPVHVPLDQETTIGGIGVACTGIGQTKNHTGRGRYPVLVEYAGPGGGCADERQTPMSGRPGDACGRLVPGPRDRLLKLPSGKTFKVDGQVGRAATQTVSAKVKAPSHGQARFVLNFPSAR